MALQIIQRHDRIMPAFAVGEELLKYLLPMDTEEEQ